MGRRTSRRPKPEADPPPGWRGTREGRYWFFLPTSVVLPETCPLCHERLARYVRAVGLEPAPWHGSYAHQQCVDKQIDKLRAVGGWQSGGDADRRSAAGAWRRRIKRK